MSDDKARPPKPPQPSDIVVRLKPGETATIKVIAESGTQPPEPPQPDPGWPNCPTHLSKLTEWNCAGQLAWTSDGSSYVDEPVPGSEGFRCIYNHEPGTLWPNDPSAGPFAGTPYGWAQERQDPTAPSSPQAVAEFTYAKGMRYGIAPATIYKEWGFGPGYREWYCGYWFKLSDPFDFGPVGCKHVFFFNGGGGFGGQSFTCMTPDRQLCFMPEYPTPPPNPYYVRRPNQPGVKVVSLGAWHRAELYVNLDTHAIRWWLDGVLQGDYTDLIEQSFAFSMVQFSSTFGGNADFFCPADQSITYDHLYVAVPSPADYGAARFIKLPDDYPWPHRERTDFPQKKESHAEGTTPQAREAGDEAGAHGRTP